jgi:hypothetical protein
LEAFQDLKQFFATIDILRDSNDPLPTLPFPLQQFLTSQNVEKVLSEIRTHTTTPATFRARFFRWFDGFLAMKYIHHARDTAYGPSELTHAARTLIASSETSAHSLLLTYRTLQRPLPS